MTVTLETNLKDGKNAIKATVTGATPQDALAEYRALTSMFPGGSPAPAAGKGKKSADATEEESQEPAVEQNVVNITQNTRTAKKLFAQQAINLNELALSWANRMAMAIPEFRGKAAQEIVEQLNFRKPLALMEIPELQEVIMLIKNTLTQYAVGNPGVAAFLKVFDVIDNLTQGTEEEWSEARQVITTGDWAVLGMPGNKGLMDYAKAQLDIQKKVLLSANAAATVAAGAPQAS